MDDRDRIEKLERRIDGLEHQIETMKLESETEAASRQRLKLKELEVEHIKIIEEDGTVRLSIHNKERMPPFGERVGGSSAGMLFFAEDGVEVGGLTIQNTVGLKFDQHHSADVVGLVGGETINGLYVWDRPPGPQKEFMEQFEREHARRPTVKEFEFDRAFIGRWINGESKVSLARLIHEFADSSKFLVN